MTQNFQTSASKPIKALKSLPDGVEMSRLVGQIQPREGLALHALARTLAPYGPSLEVTGYRGKSAFYIGSACKGTGSLLFAVDRHAGSRGGKEDETALPAFRDTLHRAGLDDVVIPVLGPSGAIARHWQTPLALLLIEGANSMSAMLADYRGWVGHIKWGGVFAMHGVYPNPADGPRPAYEIYKLALMSGLFVEVAMIQSLAILRRMGAGDTKI